MTADVNQDRRVTVVIQGLYPALSEGSRLFWALLSSVHERLGLRATEPDRIQGDAMLPHSSFTAQSRITSSHSCSRPIVPTFKPRSVLATLKAWPGNSRACRTRAATASLDRGCARRSKQPRSGRRNDPVEQRNIVPAAQGILPLDFPVPIQG